MALSKEQIRSLLGMISRTEQDSVECDACFDHLAEFAETELAGQEIPGALRAIENHLEQCACCRDEYQALIEGLRAIEED